MEPSIVKTNSADQEQLAEYSNALKDYQKTGTKQCLSIINSLLETNVTLTQLKDSKIGSSLKKIIKEEVHNDDEKALKDAILKLFTKAQKLEEQNPQPKQLESKPANGNSTTEQPKKPQAEEHKSHVTDENKPKESTLLMKRNASEANKKDALKKEAPKKAPTPTKADPNGIRTLPILEPSYRNFTLQSFSDALLMEYKTNPAEKDRLKPTANLKAIEIEKALKEKTSGENDYRMEARNLSTFMMMKANIELRRRIMDGSADCREFVKNKESFLNKSAREKMEEVSRKLLDAANADYDKKMIRESSLYECKKCKSRKISKEEKQTRSGDEPMTSFFKCIDCGAGWKE